MILIALFLSVVALLTVLLPILSFVRAQQAKRISEEVRTRLDGLESEIRRLSNGLAQQASGEAVPVPPPAISVPAPSPPVPRSVLSAPPVSPPISASTTSSPAPLFATPAFTPSAPAPPESTPARTSDGLEQLIGGRWLLYAGIAGLILGMTYFVKFAFDNGWVSEEMRVAAGVVAGLGLIAAGLRFSRTGLQLFGQALSGGGVVVLYVAIYAALHFYGLITAPPAFTLMVLVTAGAAFLAHAERAQALAMLAVVGGFATPLLIGGEHGVQLVLFTYIAILIAGTVVLVRVHDWPLLSLAAYGGTFVLVLGWFINSYDPATWLRTEMYLAAYLGLFLYPLWTARVREDQSLGGQLSRAALFTAPVLFHGASMYLLHAHSAAMLFYFLLFTLGGLVAAAATGYVWIRILTLLLVGFSLMPWMEALASPRWYMPAIVTACAIYVLHLASQWHALHDRAGSDLPLEEGIHTQLNGLLLPCTLYLFLDSRFASWNQWMTFFLALVNAAVAVSIRADAPRLYRHFVALAATLGAVSIGLAFDGPAVALGWTMEGVFLGWLALNDRSRTMATASVAMISLGAVRLVAVLQDPLAVGSWPLLNSRAAVVFIVIAALAWLAWRMRDDASVEVRGQFRNAVIVLANVLALGLLSADIHAYFSERVLDAAGGRAAVDARFMQQASLSITWAAYAVGLIAVGISRRYAPARYFAILLFALTVIKVMAVDIAELDRFYRMLSVLIVGVLLVAASYLYQRMARDSQ